MNDPLNKVVRGARLVELWEKVKSLMAADYLKKSDAAKVATSGDYNDLTNKPTIPSALKNPYPLTINGVEYDGSEAKTVTLQAGDGGTTIPGEDGGYYTPSVDSAGNLTWTASKEDMPSVSGANIKGPAGANGKTPVRGTDYWTAADIAEIKSYVDDAILNGEW